MDGSFPDSPEAVALALFYLILSKAAPANQPAKEYMLALYAACRAAVYGDDERRGPVH